MKAKVLENKASEFYIPKERYYELLHFCRQYDGWKRAMNCIDSMQMIPNDVLDRVQMSDRADPVPAAAEAREYYDRRIKMIDTAAELTAKHPISNYILECVLKDETTYETIEARCEGIPMPVGRTTFYRLYRKFFWILSGLRE